MALEAIYFRNVLKSTGMYSILSSSCVFNSIGFLHSFHHCTFGKNKDPNSLNDFGALLSYWKDALVGSSTIYSLSVPACLSAGLCTESSGGLKEQSKTNDKMIYGRMKPTI